MGVQGSASDQRPVDVFLAHQFLRVFRLNASPVLDSDALRGREIKNRGDHRADERVRFLSLSSRCGPARTDRPHGFISDHHMAKVLRRAFPYPFSELAL